MSVAVAPDASELNAPLGLYVKVPSPLTVRSAPEGSFVAVPRGTDVPLESSTLATASVPPSGSVLFVSRFSAERVALASVLNDWLTAVGATLSRPAALNRSDVQLNASVKAESFRVTFAGRD